MFLLLSIQMFLILAVHDILQILTILVLLHDLIDFHQLILADPSVQICDFFQASNLTMRKRSIGGTLVDLPIFLDN